MVFSQCAAATVWFENDLGVLCFWMTSALTLAIFPVTVGLLLHVLLC